MEITGKDNDEVTDAEMPEEEKKNKYDDENYEFIPPSLRDDAPLAGIINPEIENIDP
uniref:Uncharacterized protein n=1 Tax=Panagrolaimus sp. ES5 TaxID=591445 RepID=A0AC34G4H7_9BILA